MVDVIKAVAKVIENKLEDKYLKNNNVIRTTATIIAKPEESENKKVTPNIVKGRIIKSVDKEKIDNEKDNIPIVKGIPFIIKKSDGSNERNNSSMNSERSVYQNSRNDLVKGNVLSTNFPNTRNLVKAISKVSNKIKEYIIKKNLYAKVENYIKNKNLKEELFYIKLGNSIYYSLIKYCMVRLDENKNIISIPNKDSGFPKERIPLLVFFDRIWNDRRVCFEADPELIMSNYRKYYSNDCDGIIRKDWYDIFNNNIKKNISSLSTEGIEICINDIMNEWGSTDISIVDESKDDSEISTKIIPMKQNLGEIISKEIVSTPRISEVIQDPNDEDLDEDENEEYDDDLHSRVEIYPKEDITIIKLKYYDSVGEVSIPFQINLENFDISEIHNMVNIKNGKWDWLAHLVPDNMFYTLYPEKYLKANEDDIEESVLRFVILNEFKDNDDITIYTIGIFAFDGIFIINDDGTEDLDMGNDLLEKINFLVHTQIANTNISHLNYTIKGMHNLMIPEETIIKTIEEYNSMYDDDDDDDDEVDDIDQSEEDDDHITKDQLSKAERDAADIMMALLESRDNKEYLNDEVANDAVNKMISFGDGKNEEETEQEEVIEGEEYLVEEQNEDESVFDDGPELIPSIAIESKMDHQVVSIIDDDSDMVDELANNSDDIPKEIRLSDQEDELVKDSGIVDELLEDDEFIQEIERGFPEQHSFRFKPMTRNELSKLVEEEDNKDKDKDKNKDKDRFRDRSR